MAITNAKVSAELYAQSQKHLAQALNGLLHSVTPARCFTLPVKFSVDCVCSHSFDSTYSRSLKRTAKQIPHSVQIAKLDNSAGCF